MLISEYLTMGQAPLLTRVEGRSAPVPQSQSHMIWRRARQRVGGQVRSRGVMNRLAMGALASPAG